MVPEKKGGSMNSIFGLIILVLNVVAILDALKTQPTQGKKALWIILIILLPVIGLVLYYLVGKKKA